MKIDNLIGDNYLNRDAVMELILSKRVEKPNPASRVIVDRKVKDIVFAVLNGTSFETSDELIDSLEKNLVVILIDVYEELICSKQKRPKDIAQKHSNAGKTYWASFDLYPLINGDPFKIASETILIQPDFFSNN